MATVSAAQLRQICPRLKLEAAQTWVPFLNEAAARFDISANADRLAAWLAQAAHESGEFSKGRENMNYTSVARIRAVFKRVSMPGVHRRTNPELQAYVRAPEQFANFIYSHLLGNGNEASGDGWAYRGGGSIGLTGRAQYRECGRAIGLPLEQKPELIERPLAGALSAAWFWHKRGLNKVVDETEGERETREVTLLTNGGFNGLADRLMYAERAEQAFGLK